MADIYADEVFNKSTTTLAPEVQELREKLTEGQKLRAIYEFACDLCGDLQYDEGTALGELIEELANVVNCVDYCGLV